VTRNPNIGIRESIEKTHKNWAFLRAMHLPIASLKNRSKVFQCRVAIDDDLEQAAYVKVYASKKHSLQRYLRPSRSRQEARNLFFFSQLDIATPPVLAWGEHRNFFGKVTEDYIITASKEGAIPLDAYLRRNKVPLKRRLKMAKTLGTWLSRIHAAGFYHKDIHWRNILVRRTDGNEELFWIDCPRGRFHRLTPIRSHWRIKDLAILDKYASVLCSPVERMYFLSAYLGHSHKSSACLNFANKVSAFRKKRYDRREGRSRVEPLEPNAKKTDA
jgi:tRNA A-37 threonylcarbamoyl transferase component Bud32